MKKYTILVTIFLFIAMMFSACTPASESDRTPGATDDFDLTNEPTDIMTGTVGIPTDTMTEEPTEIMTVEPTETLAVEPTEAMTEVATEDVTPVATADATEVLPPTGFVDYHRVSNLLDLAVYTENGEQIGEVGDLIINPQTQQVDYVILQLGGFLGLGESQVPVPWNAIDVLGVDRDRGDDMDMNDNDNLNTNDNNNTNTNDNTANDNATNDNGNLTDEDNIFDESIENGLVLKISQDIAENAPDLDLSIFDSFCGALTGWDAELQNYWSTNMPDMTDDTDMATPMVNTPEAGTPTAVETPMTTGSAMEGSILATDLIGADIQAQDNPDEVGTVDDIMIDTEDGHIRFLVVNFSFDDVDSRIPLPVALLGCDVDNQAFVVLIDSVTVRGAPTFTNNEFPDTREADWDADFLDYWDDFVDMDMDMDTTP